MIETNEMAQRLKEKYGKKAIHVAKDILDYGGEGITKPCELLKFLKYWKSVIKEL